MDRTSGVSVARLAGGVSVRGWIGDVGACVGDGNCSVMMGLQHSGDFGGDGDFAVNHMRKRGG